MLAQHLITRPVFDALFEDHAFVEQNPISTAMTEVLSVIDEAGVSSEAKDLEGFYASVRRRASGITDSQARQKLIIELYDKFFRGAFPRTTQKLGIVYTPVEIVDFIIHSVDDVLREEFGQALGSEGVHIIDPFVGTGTFITRLLQSGLIAPEDLERKYRGEIHANEIVLLAYYIAAINIETVFHAVAEREAYLPFEGICLTDTFAMHEGDDELSFYMKENTDRRERQKSTEIQVILGNHHIRRDRRRKTITPRTCRMRGWIRGFDQPMRNGRRLACCKTCTTAMSERCVGAATALATLALWLMSPMRVGSKPTRWTGCASALPMSLRVCTCSICAAISELRVKNPAVKVERYSAQGLVHP